MFINFDGIGQVCASFICDSSVIVGAPCNLGANRTVSLSGEDECFMGKVLAVRDNVASVAVSGFVTFPYSGPTPGIGYMHMCGDNAGHVMLCSDGREYLVVSVDPTNKTVTVKL